MADGVDLMFKALRDRIAAAESAPAVALPRAAAAIQDKFRADATTNRGNVPGFGAMGGPITADATTTSVVVTAPDWCHEKARDLGQRADWVRLLRSEVAKAAGGDG